MMLLFEAIAGIGQGIQGSISAHTARLYVEALGSAARCSTDAVRFEPW